MATHPKPSPVVMAAALLMIVSARDFNAEHGRYPDAPCGPLPDQCFDDWAADLAERALASGETPITFGPAS